MSQRPSPQPLFRRYTIVKKRANPLLARAAHRGHRVAREALLQTPCQRISQPCERVPRPGKLVPLDREALFSALDVVGKRPRAQTRTRTATSVPAAIAAVGQHSSTHPSWNICHRRRAAAARSNVSRPSPSCTRMTSHRASAMRGITGRSARRVSSAETQRPITRARAARARSACRSRSPRRDQRRRRERCRRDC